MTVRSGASCTDGYAADDAGEQASFGVANVFVLRSIMQHGVSYLGDKANHVLAITPATAHLNGRRQRLWPPPLAHQECPLGSARGTPSLHPVVHESGMLQLLGQSSPQAPKQRHSPPTPSQHGRPLKPVRHYGLVLCCLMHFVVVGDSIDGSMSDVAPVRMLLSSSMPVVHG